MSKKIIRGFRTNMTLYSLCLIAFVAVTVPFEPLLALAEAAVAVLVILVGRRRTKMAQASVRQYMDRAAWTPPAPATCCTRRCPCWCST